MHVPNMDALAMFCFSTGRPKTSPAATKRGKLAVRTVAACQQPLTKNCLNSPMLSQHLAVMWATWSIMWAYRHGGCGVKRVVPQMVNYVKFGVLELLPVR